MFVLYILSGLVWYVWYGNVHSTITRRYAHRTIKVNLRILFCEKVQFYLEINQNCNFVYFTMFWPCFDQVPQLITPVLVSGSTVWNCQTVKPEIRGRVLLKQGFNLGQGVVTLKHNLITVTSLVSDKIEVFQKANSTETDWIINEVWYFWTYNIFSQKGHLLKDRTKKMQL